MDKIIDQEKQTSKLTNNKSNFFNPATLTILSLVLIAISGSGVWYWRDTEIKDLQNQLKNLKQSQDVQNKKDATISSSGKVVKYNNEEFDYSFFYPQSWNTSDSTNYSSAAPGLPRSGSTTIETPDLTSTNEGIGFHLTNGARMYAVVKKTEFTSPDDYINNSSLLKQIIQDKKTITVDGQQALQYLVHYESNPNLQILLVNDGKLYQLVFDYADDSALNKYKPDFDNMVKSFKLTKQ